jgi:hypothetical protein
MTATRRPPRSSPSMSSPTRASWARTRRRSLRACRQDGRGEGRLGRSPSPQSRNHDSPNLPAVFEGMRTRRDCRRNEPSLKAACGSGCGARSLPSLMGWADMPGGKAVIVVCEDCGDVPAAEREQAVLDKLGSRPMAHCGSALTYRAERRKAPVADRGLGRLNRDARRERFCNPSPSTTCVAKLR